MNNPPKYTPQQLASLLNCDAYLYGAGTTDPNCCSACTLENGSCVWHEKAGYEPYFEQRALRKDSNINCPVFIRRKTYTPHRLVLFAKDPREERLMRNFMNLPGGELK